jgi:SNF2 family DNA or RNA helicase
VTEPRPHQLAGAQFLAGGGLLLADEPRVGKTGASIVAADLALARRIIVVTTASGRANFAREVREWQAFDRRVQAIYGTIGRVLPGTDVVVVGWSTIGNKGQLDNLLGFRPELTILDESHYAKAFEAQRTVAGMALAKAADTAWCLSGTPMPNSPLDLWPMLKTLAPDRVSDLTYDQYLERYCVWRRKWVAGEMKKIIKSGKNEAELKQRLKGLWLRRTQQDVGISKPIYSLLSLKSDDRTMRQMREATAHMPEAELILDAIETGETKSLEMHLGPLRRITGAAKAQGVAEVVKEEMADGKMKRVVLMCWHTETIDILASLLKAHNPVILDGRTPATKRAKVVEDFQSNRSQVFIGQIIAAGEAIDLSVAQDLIFVEPSFTPKDMKQAALRITNLLQKGQCLVRTAALAGSIDEAVMDVLTRKVKSIRSIEQ